ncbi:MAG: signal peptidase I [Patescibacteria group bacterium]|nr:signal peptidase I [Patescibacteria group bacterium]
MRKFFSSLLEVLEIALIAVVAVYLVRTFLVQPFLVSGTSMYPNFQNGDYLLVDELTYRFRSPERGEVVVFHDPQDYSTYFIKRIIGLPGEKVVISSNAITVFDKQDPKGFALDESYLPSGTPTAIDSCNGGLLSGGTCTYALSSSSYLAFGDNRPFSYDSRSWGPLPTGDIVGLVRLRLWPLNAITAFAAPKY